MANKYKKPALSNKKENAVIRFTTRVARFLIFQSLLQIRNLKYLIIRLKAKNNRVTRRIQGSKMLLNLKDKGVSKDLLLDGIREPKSTDLVKKEVKKGDVVVDIGANIGYYALLESRIVGKSGKVYAIEPVLENINSIKRNIKLNNYSNIEVFHIAIGEKDKIAKMYIASYSNWHSFINHGQKIIGTKDMKVTSLDNFLKNKKDPDVIRMDVEGFEYNIIKGMKHVLKSKKPLKLFIELHPHLMKKEQTIYLLKTLKKYGFDTRAVIRSVTTLEMKVMAPSQYDFSDKTIQDLLKNRAIISGKKGAFEILFERK